MKNKLMRLFRAFERGVLFIDGALLVLITVLIVGQVAARKVGISISGTEELARFSYVIYTFLAWPIAGLYGTNISITIGLDRFPRKVRLMLLVLFQFVMAAFTVLATYSAWLQVLIQTGIRAPSNRWFMMDWLYRVVFVSLLVCVVFNLARAVFLLTGDMEYTTLDEKNLALIEEETEKEKAAKDGGEIP
jgi:TRAP-type C4-dicarboxylate transport system permease small subunit